MKADQSKGITLQPIEHFYTFYVQLPFIQKNYTLKKISTFATIKDIQNRLELVCGITSSIQRLHYLDGAELCLDTTISSLDIVNKATFKLNIWKRWEDLIKCIYDNDAIQFRSCLTNWIDHEDSTNKRTVVFTSAENKNKAAVTVFLASHLGRIEFLKILSSYNVSLHQPTQHGNFPLYTAIANGQYNCIDYLLDNGALYDKNSVQSQAAITVAKQNGHSNSDRHVFMFNWQLRAKQKLKEENSYNTPLLMHQKIDSRCPTWFNGPYGTTYMCSTLPSVHYSGSSLSAPLKKNNNSEVAGDKQSKDNHLPSLTTLTTSPPSKEDLNKPFDQWLRSKKQQKKVELQIQKKKEMLLKIKEKEAEKLKLFSQRKIEHERRIKAAAVRDDIDKMQKKTNIYEEFTYVPNYGRSIINELMNDIVT